MNVSNIRKYSMLISTVILCGMLLVFLGNLSSRFNKVEKNYEEYKSINLSKDISKKQLADILLNNNYVANKKDADFIADTISTRLRRGLKYPNLYFLQKRVYGKVPALVADSAKVLSKMLENSKKAVGLLHVFPSLDSIECEEDLRAGDGAISIQLYSKKPQVYANAIVILKEHFVDSLNYAADSILAYTKTDSLGVANFKGLDKEKAYSVLPVKDGFEYGSSKGIKQGKFKKDPTFYFEQLEHRIQMISNAKLKQIKNDGTITVRTPKEYKSEIVKWFVLVLLAWWALAFIMIYRKRNFDPVLLASTMFLSGICILVMFAIQNPLTEELRGVEMATGVLIGIGVIVMFQFVDVIKLYQGGYRIDFDIPLSIFNWLFLPFRQKVSWLSPILTSYGAWYKKLGALLLLLICSPFLLFSGAHWVLSTLKQRGSNQLLQQGYVFRKVLTLLLLLLCSPFLLLMCLFELVPRWLSKLPKGFGWLLLAILLTALLWTPLGKEIGGMKVNLSLLGLTFQPSEIAKYLILFFMAAFFTQNANNIIAYSLPDRTKIWSKVKILGWLIFGIMLLMALYAALGDMGPALVIGVSFVLLYSLVKSKVNLDNITENDKWKRIFTCDFAMLIYGIISFAIFMIVGTILGNALIFALLWFVAWIMFGISRHKQFFETAFVINMLIFIFVFGGQITRDIPVLRDTDTAERFEQRTKMCVNTWGNLDIEHHGNNAEPVSNTQIANGLWAIATGGMTGQGLGDGNANLIPAFHTDMILSSIGEQLGWCGLLLVVLCLALLLRRIVVVGYRVGHPFAFYFCMGVAVVSAVQFFIIALGSSGIIPLTGVTVPFLSYGKVSMILNLTAIGIVLSLSKGIKQETLTVAQELVRRRSVNDYNYPISIVTWTYIVIALFTLCVWQYYALWNRDNTLVQHAYVHSREGLPIIEYNPRIALLTKEMWAGNIYDREGRLLATSDPEKLPANTPDSIAKAHTKRYYPYGEHLFFMIGDQNNGLYFTYDESNPIGYMAEAQHLSYLRGYDNTYYDKLHKPVKLDLKGNIKTNSRYLSSYSRDTVIYYQLRDYKPLVKYLKSGIDGRPLYKHNEDVCDGNYDLHLTIDAALQKKLQEKLVLYVDSGKNEYKARYKYRREGIDNNKLLRISVVVLDADEGDLLTSANYPLPNYTTLQDAADAGIKNYNDNDKSRSWKSYTDRDLGLTYGTAPGSTAKVMSAMAGLNKFGASGKNKTYDIQLYEVIDYTNGQPVEPPMHGLTHEIVDMQKALVLSSNCYFISLVNDGENNLYSELKDIYAQVGVTLNRKNTYNLHYPDTMDDSRIDAIVNSARDYALASWDTYQQRKIDGLFVNFKDKQTMRKGEWMWAWGQGTMDATPLAMARVVSAVVNNGDMPETRYVKSDDKPKVHNVTSKKNAKELQEMMLAQYDNSNALDKSYGNIGGKTGTPHRDHRKKGEKEPQNVRDGWYVFFINNKAIDKSATNYAVAVRMERVGLSGGSSTDAMWLSREIVIPTLKDFKYIIN